jgi:hypothetical protein
MEIRKSNIDFNYDFNEIEGIQDDIFPNTFCCCIIGKPGTGKTTLLRHLLLESNLMFRKYDYVLLCSPSLNEYPFNLNANQTNNNFEIEWFYSRLLALKCKTKTNILIIIDDFISQIYENRYNSRLISLFYNRRHIVKNGVINIILTSQKFKTIPTFVRVTINIFFIFKCSVKELKSIWEEHGLISWNQFNIISTYAFSLPAGFLVYNIQDNKYFVKFDQVILTQS